MLPTSILMVQLQSLMLIIDFLEHVYVFTLTVYPYEKSIRIGGRRPLTHLGRVQHGQPNGRDDQRQNAQPKDEGERPLAKPGRLQLPHGGQGQHDEDGVDGNVEGRHGAVKDDPVDTRPSIRAREGRPELVHGPAREDGHEGKGRILQRHKDDDGPDDFAEAGALEDAEVQGQDGEARGGEGGHEQEEVGVDELGQLHHLAQVVHLDVPLAVPGLDAHHHQQDGAHGCEAHIAHHNAQVIPPKGKLRDVVP